MQNVSNKEKRKNIIHTQGTPQGIVIGEKKDINGRRALEVKNHQKVDYIYADELVQMLYSPL